MHVRVAEFHDGESSCHTSATVARLITSWFAILHRNHEANCDLHTMVLTYCYKVAGIGLGDVNRFCEGLDMGKLVGRAVIKIDG